MSEPDSNRKPWWEGDYVYRPRADEDVLEPVDTTPPPPPDLIACWRCGKPSEEGTAKCPYCLARLRPDRRDEGRARGRTAESSSPLMRIIWAYLLLLLISLVHGLILLGAARAEGMTVEESLHLALVVEIIDTVLVVLALFWVGRPPPLPRTSVETRAATFVGAAPALALLLGVNLAYHWLLRRLISGPGEDVFLQQIGLSALSLFVVCVQPAVVEELFFRYLALGALRRNMGTHAAVLVSSVMFGMAHIGQFLSIPVLVLVGMGLGYIRVASGSLALPMVLHFLHNLAVLVLESSL